MMFKNKMVYTKNKSLEIKENDENNILTEKSQEDYRILGYGLVVVVDLIYHQEHQGNFLW